MSQDRSAEFLRGAVAALDLYAHDDEPLLKSIAHYRALLAAAEAREAGETSAELEIDRACATTVNKTSAAEPQKLGTLSVRLTNGGKGKPLDYADDTEGPSAAAVIEAAEKALEKSSGYVSAFESLHKCAWGDAGMCKSAKDDLTETEDLSRAAIALIARWKEAHGE